MFDCLIRSHEQAFAIDTTNLETDTDENVADSDEDVSNWEENLGDRVWEFPW